MPAPTLDEIAREAWRYYERREAQKLAYRDAHPNIANFWADLWVGSEYQYPANIYQGSGTYLAPRRIRIMSWYRYD